MLPEKNAEPKPYSLSFKCLNCGHRFTRDIPYGVKVSARGWSNSCWAGDAIIRCPRCGVSEVDKDLEK